MALAVTSISLTGSPALLAKADRGAEMRVRLQSSVAITVGGTASDCNFHVPAYDVAGTSPEDTEFHVTLQLGETLYGNGTATVLVLRQGI